MAANLKTVSWPLFTGLPACTDEVAYTRHKTINGTVNAAAMKGSGCPDSLGRLQLNP